MEINLSTVLMSMVNFFILLFIVKKFLYKPILNVLDEREASVKATLAGADAAKEEAEALRACYSRTLQDAHREAKEILNKATKVGEEEKARFIEESKKEILTIHFRAKEELARDKETAFLSLKEEIADLAIEASSIILGREVKKEDHEQAIKDYLSQRVEV